MERGSHQQDDGAKAGKFDVRSAPTQGGDGQAVAVQRLDADVRAGGQAQVNDGMEVVNGRDTR